MAIGFVLILCALCGTVFGGLLSSVFEYDPSDKTDSSYDFIIVGGGTSGCVLANRLSKNRRWKVLLLEAGDEENIDYDIPAVPTHKVQSINWNFATMPNNYSCISRAGGSCIIPGSGRVLGGSSVTNDMKYQRGSRHDYDEWSRMGCKGWNYASILDFFKMSENNGDREMSMNTFYHSTGGPLHVAALSHQDVNVKYLIKACNKMGLKSVDSNSNIIEGVMTSQLTQENNTRMSTNSAFLKPIRRRKNLKVIVGAYVTKIIINRHSKVAEGVEYQFRNKSTHKAYAEMEVILSAGTINSAKLLMLSGIGPKQHLQKLNITLIKDLPVGKRYQDHPTMGGLGFTIHDQYKGVIEEDTLITDFRSWFYNKTGSIGSTGISQVSVFMKKTSNHHGIAADIGFEFESNYVRSDKFLLTNLSVAAVEEQNQPLSYYNYISVKPVVLKPQSIGNVTLNSNDPYDEPIINANMLKETSDLESMVDGLEMFTQLLDTYEMKYLRAKIMHLDYGRCNNMEGKDMWRCVARHYTTSMGHPIGTCMMGSRHDKSTVVDPSLKVHGIDGLRVIDASVMPSHVRGNVYAATIMIAEKGAKIIEEYWTENDDYYEMHNFH